MRDLFDPTPESENVRVVLCPTCGSEGVIIRAYRNDPDNETYSTCPHCEGAKEVLIEVEPIDIDDLPPPQTTICSSPLRDADGQPMTCVCGKSEADGVRCRFGAMHNGRGWE